MAEGEKNVRIRKGLERVSQIVANQDREETPQNPSRRRWFKRIAGVAVAVG